MRAFELLAQLRDRAVLVCWLALAALSLGACAGQQEWATDQAVQSARYVHGGAPELTLVTIMNYATKNGDHTALFINGTERVLFDPAGSWKLDTVPERNDMHYGITPQVGASFYMSHVRPSHYAVVQRLRVSPEVAEQVKAMALAAGPVAPARCALQTSNILRTMPGFGGIRSSWYPHRLMEDFANLPGVQTYEVHHDAPDVLQTVYRLQAPL
jgi:hypothetical protein